MKKLDVCALGELLIDFTSNGRSEQGNSLFEANPGGAPCNVLAMLSKLGKRTSFIGKVGDDLFGRFLAETLDECGIDKAGLAFDKSVPTTLAFVSNKDGGEREFAFYRNPGADMMLSSEDIRDDIISGSKIFHFGSLSSTYAGCKKATRLAIDIAKKNGVIISFDPNLRESLWSSLEDAKKEIEYGLSVCDILKISDNELDFLTLCGNDFDNGIEIIQKKYNIPLIFLTLGADGSRAYYKSMRIEAPIFSSVTSIEKTGAGDTFMGCVLSKLLDCKKEELNENKLFEILLFANAGAALITERKGALRVMPSEEEILNLINT